MDELEKIQAQIAELQKQAEGIAQHKKATVVEEIKAKIRAYGISAKDLGFSDKGSPSRTSSGVVKYKLDDKTWTGKGRPPKWAADYVAQGGDMKNLLVR